MYFNSIQVTKTNKTWGMTLRKSKEAVNLTICRKGYHMCHREKDEMLCTVPYYNGHKVSG